MYYPYLRGRQFELIALREFAKVRGDKNNIIPIIEPIKKTFNSLKLALPILIESDVKFALVLNPQVGEIENENQILEGLEGCLDNLANWIPAFIVKNNYNEIKELILLLDYNNVMIICSELTDTNNADFIELISLINVQYIVSEENQGLKRFLRGKGKNLIKLVDNFKGEKRNSDYLKMPEKRFTEDHYYYKIEGNFQGFSDYTVLVSDFLEGGSAPYAVSIHLTYKKSAEEIWIRHFTSTSNYDRANIQGKFAEAAKKAVFFLNENGIVNEATNELRKYYNEEKYPGLGMVKKIAIKNHLELINEVINLED